MIRIFLSIVASWRVAPSFIFVVWFLFFFGLFLHGSGRRASIDVHPFGSSIFISHILFLLIFRYLSFFLHFFLPFIPHLWLGSGTSVFLVFHLWAWNLCHSTLHTHIWCAGSKRISSVMPLRETIKRST